MEAGLAALGNARRVFGDTSYFFALLDPADIRHPRAIEVADEVRARRFEVVTTWDVVVESAALLRYRADFALARTFMTELLPRLSVVHSNQAERALAIELFLTRGKGRRISLCDALSYAVVSRRLDWAPCLSFDDDFAALGLSVVR